MKKQIISVVVALFLLGTTPIGSSQAADLSKARAFFKGKTITWMIGSTPGGSVDGYSRLVGPYFAKHTGAKVVLQNRPGGGGVAAFNYVYSKAKPDGLKLAFHIGSTQVLSRITGRAGINYKVEDMSWIGVVAPTSNTFTAYKKRFKSIEDIKRAGKVRWGLTRPGGNNHFIGITLSKVLGIDVQFVPGYAGSSSVRQALYSGEVDVAAYPASLFASGVKEGLVVLLITMGEKRHPAAPDTPTLQEAIKKIPSPFDTWTDISRVGWFLVGAPNMPKDRLTFLRMSLKKATQDPEMLKRAKKQQYLIGYLEPEKAREIALNMLQMPDAERKQLQGLLKLKKRP